MQTKTIWMVVASKARARIFSVGAIKTMPLTEIHILVDPQSRLRQRDVDSDRPGRSYDRVGGGRHAMEAGSSLRQESTKRFAARVCDYLERAHQQNRFQSLIVVASAEFTGLLRRQMSSQLNQCIASEIHKNISDLPQQAIRRYLLSRSVRV
jgi:protein required for attachment to host cells